MMSERTPLGSRNLELGLGGMDVDVNLVGRQRQEQREHGIAPLRQEIAVSRADRAGEQLVAHRPPVDDKMELKPVRPVQRRQAGKTLEQDAAAFGPHGKRILDKVGSEDAPEPRETMIDQARRAGFEAKDGALLARERKRDVRPRQREPLHHLGDGRILRAFGLHEFQPRGGGVKQVADFDPRSGGERTRFELRFAAGIDGNLMSIVGALRAARDREPGDGADRRQRLAAKAKRQDRREIVAR